MALYAKEHEEDLVGNKKSFHIALSYFVRTEKQK